MERGRADGRMASSSGLDQLSTQGVRLRVQTLLGHNFERHWPVTATIREVKEVIACCNGLDPRRQTLVRCGGGQASFVQLDDRRTLQEYGLVDDERLLLIPVVRSGPMTDPGMARLFPDFGNGVVTAAIDRMLKEQGQARKPDHAYALAQLDTSKPGEWRILESRKDSTSSQSISIDHSKQASQRALNIEEQKQNKTTREKMRKIQEEIERKKRARKQKAAPASPTPFAKMEKNPCGHCGALTENQDCLKCGNAYCGTHVKRHVCDKKQQCSVQ